MEVDVVMFIIIGIIVVIIIIAPKNSGKSLETSNENEVDASKEKWENQLQEIQNKRLNEEEKISQLCLLINKEHIKIEEQFWPRIEKVSRELALAIGCEYKEDPYKYLRPPGMGNIHKPYMVGKTCHMFRSCQISKGEHGDMYDVDIYLTSETVGSSNRLFSQINVYSKYRMDEYISIAEFTEELLLAKLRRAMKV